MITYSRCEQAALVRFVCFRQLGAFVPLAYTVSLKGNFDAWRTSVGNGDCTRKRMKTFSSWERNGGKEIWQQSPDPNFLPPRRDTLGLETKVCAEERVEQ